jgi:hypothetical protein
MNFYEQIFSRGRATGEGMTHFERLFAAKFGGPPPPEVREYTGPVPVTITADGTPLIDYLISGNTTQSGTPTPDSPIMPEGTGERTGNLFYKKIGGVNISAQGKIITNSEFDMVVAKVTEGETYSVSGVSGVMGFYVSEPELGSTSYNNARDAIVSPVTIPQGVNYVAYRVSDRPNVAMLNTGSTALPYEPYGYKIPILSAGQTTPVYLGEVETTRKIKKLVLTGTDADGEWKASPTYTGSFYLKTGHANGIIKEGMCDRATNVKELTDYNYGKMYVEKSGLILLINLWLFDTAITLADFKSYLAQQYAAGTPVVVWYVLAEPEIGTVNEPLMKIGDYADTVSKAQAGVSIPTNNGSTTVDVSTELKPSEVYIKYMG